jgi:hypothetical protein
VVKKGSKMTLFWPLLGHFGTGFWPVLARPLGWSLPYQRYWVKAGTLLTRWWKRGSKRGSKMGTPFWALADQKGVQYLQGEPCKWLKKWSKSGQKRVIFDPLFFHFFSKKTPVLWQCAGEKSFLTFLKKSFSLVRDWHKWPLAGKSGLWDLKRIPIYRTFWSSGWWPKHGFPVWSKPKLFGPTKSQKRDTLFVCFFGPFWQTGLEETIFGLPRPKIPVFDPFFTVFDPFFWGSEPFWTVRPRSTHTDSWI